MFYTIYRTTHTESGKALQLAIKKYGVEAFHKEILHIFTSREEMISKEVEILTEEFLNSGRTYNMKRGGLGGFDLLNRRGAVKFHGRKHSESTRSVISKKLSGRVRPDLSEAQHLSYKRDPSRIEGARLGGRANAGIPKSPEHRQKISASLSGPRPPERVEASKLYLSKAREAKASKPVSEETRKKLSESAKRRHQKNRDLRG